MVLKIVDKETFDKIKFKKITLVELQKYFYDSIKLKFEISTNQQKRDFVRSESYIVFMYNEYLSNYDKRFELLKRLENGNVGEYELNFKSLIDTLDNQQLFLNNIIHLSREFNRGGTILESFFSKMELLEGFKN